MVPMLMVVGIFAYTAGVFALRYFIGEKICWYRVYLEQGYQILLSRRTDAYLFDTLAVCGLSLLGLMLHSYGSSAPFHIDTAMATIGGMTALFFLGARFLERSCALYDSRGLLLSKPFRCLRTVPWIEIGNIQKRGGAAQLYNVFDLVGHRLTWVPLNKKTQPFFELAQHNGVAVNRFKSSEMALGVSGKKLNGSLGEWDAVLARSAYAKNDVMAFAVFRGFMVALFMDRRLSENNIIAINQDGTVRWRISEIIKEEEPASYAAMTRESADTICMMAVRGRQYENAVFEINVYEQKIVSQHSGEV